MSDFAKIFHHEQYGQILAYMGQHDGELAIIICIKLPHPLDVCMANLQFMSNNRQVAFERRQAVFDELTLEKVLPHVVMLHEQAPKIDPETGKPHATH